MQDSIELETGQPFKCKIIYQKEDGNFILLELVEEKHHTDENGELIRIIHLKEKGKNE